MSRTPLALVDPIEELDLTSQPLGLEMPGRIATTLRCYSFISTLSLEKCGLNDEDIITISNGIPHDSILRVLNLDGNQLGGLKSCASALATALRRTQFIEELYLNNNYFGDAGTEIITAAFGTESKLIRLELNNNEIGDAGARFLGDLMHRTTSLTYLSLARNSISDDGCAFITLALPYSTSLNELDLSHNPITPGGIALFFDPPRNSHLGNVNLAFTYQGCPYFANLSRHRMPSLRNGHRPDAPTET